MYNFVKKYNSHNILDKIVITKNITLSDNSNSEFIISITEYDSSLVIKCCAGMMLLSDKLFTLRLDSTYESCEDDVDKVHNFINELLYSCNETPDWFTFVILFGKRYIKYKYNNNIQCSLDDITQGSLLYNKYGFLIPSGVTSLHALTTYVKMFYDIPNAGKK